KGRLSSNMNPVYSPVQPGTPYGNPKNIAYAVLLVKQGWPQASGAAGALEGSYDLAMDAGSEGRQYQASAAAFSKYDPMYSTHKHRYCMYAHRHTHVCTHARTRSLSHTHTQMYIHTYTHVAHTRWHGWGTFRAGLGFWAVGKNGLGKGYTAGTPYKVPPGQSNGAPPPYSPSPNPYQTAMYPIRSAYPQQNLYAQPMYAAQPHVIHHTTVVQPNSIPSALYPAPVQQPRSNGHMYSADHASALHSAHRWASGYPANIPAPGDIWV
ncbi:unnamed protein product, partial [Coregonus sp. 'balchen']